MRRAVSAKHEALFEKAQGPAQAAEREAVGQKARFVCDGEEKEKFAAEKSPLLFLLVIDNLVAEPHPS